MTSGSTITLQDAVHSAATGDIWLFRGKSFADVTIRAYPNVAQMWAG